MFREAAAMAGEFRVRSRSSHFVPDQESWTIFIESSCKQDSYFVQLPRRACGHTDLMPIPYKTLDDDFVQVSRIHNLYRKVALEVCLNSHGWRSADAVTRLRLSTLLSVAPIRIPPKA